MIFFFFFWVTVIFSQSRLVFIEFMHKHYWVGYSVGRYVLLSASERRHFAHPDKMCHFLDLLTANKNSSPTPRLITNCLWLSNPNYKQSFILCLSYFPASPLWALHCPVPHSQCLTSSLSLTKWKRLLIIPLIGKTPSSFLLAFALL